MPSNTLYVPVKYQTQYEFSKRVQSSFFWLFWRLNIQFLRVRIQKRKDQPDTRFLYTHLTTNFPRYREHDISVAGGFQFPRLLRRSGSLQNWMHAAACGWRKISWTGSTLKVILEGQKQTKQPLNLHHEVINVHGPGSLVTEISLLQNAVDHPADAEICWDFLSRRSTTFQKTSIYQRLKRCPEGPRWEAHTLTHHIVYRAVNPVVLFQQLLYCSGPGHQKSTWHFTNQTWIKATCALSRQVLTWKPHWGFCFSSRRLFWRDHPIPYWDKRKQS